ncbi:unnamed protein product [Linum trigynum]|uniref:Uncharacterized protein n=1 Tax=Linum trigynum TaxID=586398 RepID=A0AAV2DQL6_9ROSI
MQQVAGTEFGDRNSDRLPPPSNDNTTAPVISSGLCQEWEEADFGCQERRVKGFGLIWGRSICVILV